MKTNSHLSIHALICLTLFLGGGITTFAQTPTLHANGKIAFSDYSYDNPYYPWGHSGISVMNADGSGRTQLTSSAFACPQLNRPPGFCGPDQIDTSPVWSPDGEQIAFIRAVPTPNFGYDSDVFVMNADGSNQRRLTQLGSVSWSRPTWSPDGTKLAFAGPHLVDDYYPQVYVMNADGSNQRPIGRGEEPAWSPDGSKLVFNADRGLYVMNPDGSGRARITAPNNPSPNLSDHDSEPSWSPDGDRILFNRWTGCDWDDNCQSLTIWTVNADGTNPGQLTDILTADASWSPDGTKIVFVWLGNGDRYGDLFTMDSNGSNISRLTNTPYGYEGTPSWQPLAPAACATLNPIDCPDFFVRQQYRDFLGREPDDSGFANWVGTLTGCANGGFGEFNNPYCDRVHVSAGFVQSNEFQGRGYWILRFGYVGLNRSIGSVRSSATYAEFTPALAQVGGSNSPAQEEAAKVAYANAFVQRLDFLALFPLSMTAAQYVNGLENNGQVSLSNKQTLIDGLTAGTMTRAEVLRNVVESQVVFDKYIIPSFVTMEYFGYLRRDPDEIGYQNWVDTLTGDPNNYRHMIFGFIYSTEYRSRFGTP
jgi:hypothetical protein